MSGNKLSKSLSAIVLPLFSCLRRMKNKAVILLFVFQLLVCHIYAQVNGLTIHVESVPMEEVFDQLEKMTDYVFLYQGNVVDAKKKVTLKQKNATLTEVLDALFKGMPVKYVVSNKQIILSKTTDGQQGNNVQPQKRTVKGVVVDNAGAPLTGVTVVDKNDMGVGTITDFDGRYNLTLDGDNPVLVVSFIGMKTLEIPADFSKEMKVLLQDDSKSLEEVVVTAMGIERKAKSLTYATQTIGGQELTRAKDANFINSLQGKSAGLVITPNAGGAGSASKILLRGNSSIEGNNSPLIVVDGIPMSNNVSGQFDSKAGGYAMAYAAASEGSDALSNINPDDIASITVLKGANAAALYGSAAANGVIIVKTKQGRQGAIRVDVSSSTMFETPLVLPDLQDSFGSVIRDGKLEGRSWGKLIKDQTAQENSIDGIAGFSGNDVRKFFKLGSNFNNSVALSGGSDNVQSYFSYANTTANGMVPNNKFQRNSFSARQSYKFLNDALKIEISANYINQKTNNRIGGGTVYNPLYNLYLAPRNLDMNYYKNQFEAQGEWVANPIRIIPKYEGGIGRLPYDKTDLVLSGMQQVWFQGRGVPAANNPYWLTNRIGSEDIMDRIYGTLSVSYQINEYFNVQGRANYDRSEGNGDTKRYATLVDPTGQYLDRGDYAWWKNENKELFSDFLLNYNRNLGTDYSLSATVGGSLNKSEGNHFWMRNHGASAVPYYTSEEDLPTTINVFYPNASYATTRDFRLSSDWSKALFGTAQLGFREGAYLDFSYRIDWSRAFSQFKTQGVKDYYGYYSVGANVLVNEFVHLGSLVNQLKLRGSYSEVGNSIPNKLYSEQPYDPATGRIKAATYTDFDHPLPETVRSVEGGFDLAMFGNRMNLDVTLYSTTMFNQYLPITSSIGSIKPINTGKVRNRGVETSLSYDLRLGNQFAWKSGFNFSYNTNKILKTYQSRNDIYISIGQSDNLRVKFLEGGSYGDMYAKDFTRLRSYDVEKLHAAGITDAKIGDIKLNPDGTPSMYAKGGHSVYLGNMNAKYNLGWHNTFSYKDLSLYMLVDGKIGGKVVSFTEAYLDAYGVSKRTANARLSGRTVAETNEDGVSVQVPAVVMPDGKLASAEKYYSTIGDQIFPTEYVYDATNFRMREISLGYTFRGVLGEGKNINASLVGRNLFFLYKDAPVDPDISMSTQNALGGVDIFNMPSARTFGVNLKLTF